MRISAWGSDVCSSDLAVRCVARGVHQPGLAQHRACAGLVRGPDDPHLRHLVAFAAIGEVAADAALVRAAVGDAHLDAVILEQLGDAFDVLEPGAGEDLSPRMLTASPAPAGTNRPPCRGPVLPAPALAPR